MQSVLLIQKDTSTWEVLQGAWAFIQYVPCGPEFEFIITTSGLDSDTAYSLIYYADSAAPPSGASAFPVMVIHTWDSGNDVDGSFSDDIGTSLPTWSDKNRTGNDYYASDGYANPYGAKLWLVPTEDIDSSSFLTWTDMADYLWETNLIMYIDTDTGPFNSIP
jgi:hypothetical protein